MNEPKQYQIKTVQDMIDCTDESNIDAFITDLRELMRQAHIFKTLTNSIGKAQGVSKEKRRLKTDGFTWIDDGNNGAMVTISTDA